ncbi:acetyl-CoA carboxylase biotin carboxyl carrier protein [Fictibacillus aquaticus]|uniref:Biotin carboxyl carrier protein of acetyl-CoA carboxylase n=1 Tax=Fictibacillus aquaticus TaxID=2021314 RepID=A0A235FAK0_9BACL|nr:acetyl-CoA carboxylase biotin carboxyl carrier protein [Fictibacillus aquaticus]OYD58326.1 acetyl-CoA carboxylase, biotin carboxyl carrier protein [Fictibacillus aquaticus]
MLKIQEIRELIKLIDKSSINEFKYENDGAKIVLKKNGVGESQLADVSAPAAAYQPAPAAIQPQAPVQSAPAAAPQAPAQEQPKAADENLHKIVSPMVGTFYSASAPDQPSFVKSGDKVSKDSIVCIIEAMKLFNEIESEVNGEIVEVLVENGQLVEYGQPLFLVKSE